MTKTYTVGEIPKNRPFRVKGSDIELIKTPDGVMANTTEGLSIIDIAILMRVNDETETDSIRPIYTIDPTTIVASFQNNFLMDTGDGYTLETFTPDGEVHFARYFRPQNLHRAVAALQELMPEQIPHWANTHITRPNGSQQYTASDVYNAIRDTFFIGYDGALNSVEYMERVLADDGWVFNDLTQEQTLTSNGD